MTTLDRRNFVVAVGSTLLLPAISYGYIAPSHAVLKRAQVALDQRRGLQVALLGRTDRDSCSALEIGERWLSARSAR